MEELEDHIFKDKREDSINQVAFSEIYYHVRWLAPKVNSNFIQQVLANSRVLCACETRTCKCEHVDVST